MTAAPDYYGFTPGIHEMPGAGGPGFDWESFWKELQAKVRFFFDAFLGQVALAFGAIDILGWKPFEFLTQWGQDRIDEASRNYDAAMAANSAAANAASANQATAAKVGILDIPGGVSVTDGFAYPAGQLPDPPYGIHFTGGGSGLYVANGDGLLVWESSGNADRYCIYNHNQSLGTNNGFATAVFERRPAAGAQNLIIGRWGPLSRIQLAVQDGLAGVQRTDTTTTTNLAVTSIELNKDVDVWEFWWGTQADETLLWVVRNGTRIPELDCTDSVHNIDADHRYCALGGMAKAGTNNQRKPAELNSWTFADQNI